MYKHNLSCDCDLQIYLGITPKTTTKGRRWILILVDPDSVVTQWFYTKPDRDGGHVHARGRDIPWSRNIFSDRIWIGTLPDKYVDFFNETYWTTRTAPSHAFVANIIKALSKRGMVERAVVDEIRVAAGDSSSYEWGFVNAYSSNIGRDEPTSPEERRMSGLSGVLARIGLQIVFLMFLAFMRCITPVVRCFLSMFLKGPNIAIHAEALVGQRTPSEMV